MVNQNSVGRRVRIANGKCLNSRHRGKEGVIRDKIHDGRVRVYWDGGNHKKVTYLPTDLQYVDTAPTQSYQLL